MESPNYAKWIPEAGGYVHNGSVVSTTPLYDDTGRQKVDVDLSALSITPPSATTQPVQEQTGNVDTYDYTKGVGGAFGWKANQANSGVDVNADLTKAGSLGTLNANTENPGLGVLNTPATKSSSAQEAVLTPVDQVLKDLEYMVATNNIKGQIDQYTKLSELTGEDYTQKINSLWKQRGQKVQQQDDAYLQQINQALQYGQVTGDYTTYNQLVQEQQAWRDKVGYQDQINMDYNNKMQDLQLVYEDTYLKGLNDIANNVMSSLSDLINFQYNPQLDMNLQLAQGYAVGAVKEQMNHTGMYYSSMTQSAITRAVAELIPVYEKMAKDEIKENISLMMNVGNYLMNIEKTQFDLWKSQIELQFEANNEKRKEVAQAIETANARGYYNNEEAILLGIPAGTESSEARKRAQEKQDKIDEDLRSLEIKKTVMDYQQQLDLEKMYWENEYKKDYWNQQVSNPKPSSTNPNDRKLGGTMKADDLIGYYNDLKNAGYDDAVIDQELYNSAYSIEDYNRATTRINSGNTNPIGSNGNGKKHELTISQFKEEIQDSAFDKKPSELIDEIYEEYNGEDETLNNIISTVQYPKNDESELSKKNIFNSKLFNSMGKEAYKTYADYLYEADGDPKALAGDMSGLVSELDNKYNSKTITEQEYNAVIDEINRSVIPEVIKSNETNYGSTASKTNDATVRSRTIIEDFADKLQKSSLPDKDAKTVETYKSLMDSIANAGDNYDYSGWWFNEGITSRTDAIADIVKRTKDTYGDNSDLYYSINAYANYLQGAGKINDITGSWWS